MRTGALVAIRWNGRRETVEVCNRWRVEEAWWRGPIARDYFKVVGDRWLALVYRSRSGTRTALRLGDSPWHLGLSPRSSLTHLRCARSVLGSALR